MMILKARDLRPGMVISPRTPLGPDVLRSWRRDGNAGSGGAMPGAEFVVDSILKREGQVGAMIYNSNSSPPVYYFVPESQLTIFRLLRLS